MADVILETTIKDAYVTRCAAAIPKVVNSHVTVSIQGFHNRSDGEDISASKSFNVPVIVGESVKDMAERVTKYLFLSACRTVEISEAKIAEDAAHAAVPPASSDLPDEAIE